MSNGGSGVQLRMCPPMSNSGGINVVVGEGTVVVAPCTFFDATSVGDIVPTVAGMGGCTGVGTWVIPSTVSG